LAASHGMLAELISIDGDEHFLTERYDRRNGKKIHTQTLAAMNPHARNYEDLMTVIDKLNIPYKEKEITVKNLHWTEMGNGAMRLEAELNGIPFRATFAKKSKEYPAIMENGGIKMPFEKQKEYVERLFLPRVTS